MKPISEPNNVHTEVWFIHGANATPASFNFLKAKLELIPELNNYLFRDVTYDCQDNLATTVRVLLSKVPREVPLYLVGHSLGGVIATAFAKKVQESVTGIDLRGVITLASPLGGSESANYLRFIYPHYNLFKNISTVSPVIREIQSFVPEVPFVSVVTNSGNNPLFPTANDGVVTVMSQRTLKGPEYVELASNHFEVLVSPDTVDIMKQFFSSVEALNDTDSAESS